MSDEESKFNEEFDVTKAMHEGQLSADKFMDNVAAKAKMFDEMLEALERLNDCMTVEVHAALGHSFADFILTIERARAV